MNEITHRRDPDTGRMVQVVTPERLSQILRRDGDTLDRPSDFDDDDEWEVTDDDDGEVTP